MSIGLALIVAVAIATLSLGPPAFAPSGYDNGTKKLQPVYYPGKRHAGLPPHEHYQSVPLITSGIGR